jgi:hypothetical protein
MYQYQIGGTKLFIPLDYYAIGIKITQGASGILHIEQVRKVAGRSFSEQLSALAEGFTSLKDYVHAILCSTQEGVSQADAAVAFDLVPKGSTYEVVPSASKLVEMMGNPQ